MYERFRPVRTDTIEDPQSKTCSPCVATMGSSSTGSKTTECHATLILDRLLGPFWENTLFFQRRWGYPPAARRSSRSKDDGRKKQPSKPPDGWFTWKGERQTTKHLYKNILQHKENSSTKQEQRRKRCAGQISIWGAGLGKGSWLLYRGRGAPLQPDLRGDHATKK